jgi:predicted Zn-dependent protease
VVWAHRILLLLWIGLVCGCSRLPILTSESQEAELGAEAYQQVLAKYPRSQRADWNALVQRVGKRIAGVANKPDYQWEFALLESDEQNAFCLPGGKIAVYTGILPVARDEAGLAVILGHEVSHATLRHAGQRMTLLLGSEIGMEGLHWLLGGPDSAQKKLLLAALGLGTQVGVVLPFSREQESQADSQGLIYTAEAGYDPQAAPELWQRMQASEGGAVPAFLSDHPASADREKRLRAELPQVMPLYEKSPRYGMGEVIPP